MCALPLLAVVLCREGVLLEFAPNRFWAIQAASRSYISKVRAKRPNHCGVAE